MNEEVEREFPFIFLMGALYPFPSTIFLILNICARTVEMGLAGRIPSKCPDSLEMAYAIGSSRPPKKSLYDRNSSKSKPTVIPLHNIS